MSLSLRIATYNLHKGMSPFHRRHVLPAQREALADLDLDLVFLQEAQGRHVHRARRHEDWPAESQPAALAEDRHHAYGANARYQAGHHGNAILSRHLILSTANQDVSDHRFERRGLLHCQVEMPQFDVPVHCVCVHLGLMAGSRRRQMAALAERMEQLAPGDAPLIIAGDFNDWRNHADDLLGSRLGLTEAFGAGRGRPARSFPSALPFFRLDRIYVRGFRVRQAQVHYGAPWAQISDHAALTADLEPER